MVRFHLGPVPEDSDFDPDANGWIRLREPAAGKLLAVSILGGVALAVPFVLAWYLLIRPEAPASGFSVTITAPALLGTIFAIAVFIFLHEALHVVPMLFADRSVDSDFPRGDIVMGFWPRNLAPYVAYLGTTSRELQLLSGAMPFLLLTLLPFAVGAVFPAIALWTAALSIVNVLGSAADLIMLAFIVRQVPRGALMRSQGFETWWRPTA